MTRRRVLVVTPDRVGPCHAGIALRHLGIARALWRRGFDVTLASTDQASSWSQGEFRYTNVDAVSVRACAKEHDVCIVQGSVMRQLPALQEMDIPIIVDLICPIFLENLERFRGSGAEGDAHVRSDLDLGETSQPDVVVTIRKLKAMG